jgi:aminoglycoside 6'-N-acetyltransferase
VKAVDLESERALLRRVVPEDLPDLARLRSEPEVARWWQARTADQFADEEAEAEAEGEAHWTVWVDDERVGFIQAYEETDPDYRRAGIDLFVASRWHGRHLGREITALVARHLFDDLGHHRVIIDPTLANEAAVRCYEAVGFRRVGVMRDYWYDHVEQRWADGLLMDLLPADLTDPAKPGANPRANPTPTG